MQIVSLLVTGAVLGAVLLGIAFALRRYTALILVIGLIIAALFYVWFSLAANETSLWLMVELAGLCIYGTMGLLALRGSPWWLASGWGLHAVWDIALHYFGPGRSFAPVGYTVLCASLDLVVAAYVAYRTVRGWRLPVKDNRSGAIRMTVVSVAIFLLAGQTIGSQSTLDWTVYLRRVGPIRIGMPIAEVRRVLGDRDAFLEWTGREPDNSECAYLQSPAIPKSLGLMFQKGLLVRVDVRETGIRTASGVGVGDTKEKIKGLYGSRITVEPHHYLPETGHYLKYTPVDGADRAYEIIFETEDSRVTRFRTGTRAAVALVEGCS
jgi:hypothetical protein